MMAISSINVKPVKPASEAHNKRSHQMEHIHEHLSGNNEQWIAESIHVRNSKIKEFCKRRSGRAMQRNATPIREAVVNLNEHHNLKDLHRLADAMRQHFKIDAFQMYLHRDEGLVLDDGSIKINHHAHLLFDYQNKETGKMLSLGRLDMVKMQTLVADVLGMERGQEGSKAVRLEAQAYKAQQDLLQAEAELRVAEAAKAKAEHDRANMEAEAEAAAHRAQQEIAEAKEQAAQARDETEAARKKKDFIAGCFPTKAQLKNYDDLSGKLVVFKKELRMHEAKKALLSGELKSLEKRLQPFRDMWEKVREKLIPLRLSWQKFIARTNHQGHDGGRGGIER